MNQTIQVYFNSHDITQPWIVALHDGVSITKIYQQFRSPGVAIQYAKNAVAAKVNLPVVWPDGLKVSA
jgi:hypothetical protein